MLPWHYIKWCIMNSAIMSTEGVLSNGKYQTLLMFAINLLSLWAANIRQNFVSTLSVYPLSYCLAMTAFGYVVLPEIRLLFKVCFPITEQRTVSTAKMCSLNHKKCYQTTFSCHWRHVAGLSHYGAQTDILRWHS